jgi:uncharacterized protein (TIGR02118 family)
MVKVVFVLYRKAGVTHAQALADWGGAQHTSAVRKIPGLKRWVQNHPAELPNESTADGIGELWFEDAQSMQQAMASQEMAAAFEDSKRFADLAKTYGLVVDEKSMI